MIPESKHIRLAVKSLFIFFIILIIVFISLLTFVYSQFDGTGDISSNYDCAVVFGAAVHNNTQSGPGIERRVKTAANLYVSGNAKRLLLTGGKGEENNDSEAEVMRRTAMRFGVAPEDIFLEDKATSTWENMMFSRAIIKEMSCTAPIVGISDGYHLARIRFIAFRQGWENFRTLPAGDRPDIVFERLSILREVLGLLYYFVDSFVDIDGNL